MGKEIVTQVQETQRVLNRTNPRGNTPRHILIKLKKTKHKEQILKAVREKQQITHKGIPIRITTDLSIETLQARRQWPPTPVLLPGKIPWMEEPGRLHSMGSLSRACPSDFTFTFHFPASEKEMETYSSVLAWRTQGWGNLVGCLLWGRTELDTTEVT